MASPQTLVYRRTLSIFDATVVVFTAAKDLFIFICLVLLSVWRLSCSKIQQMAAQTLKNYKIVI